MSLSAQTRDYLRRLGPTGLLALVWIWMPALMGFAVLVWIGPISDWLTARETAGVIIYVAVFIVAAGFGLLPTYAQAILGGWVFGVAIGVPAALMGFTGAALIGYGIARSVSRDRVERTIEENPRARVIHQALVGKSFVRTLLIVTLLRMPPNSPFALTNLVMASAGVAIVPYVIGTMVGMLPRTALAVALATAASREARDIVEFIDDGPGLLVLIVGLVMMFIVLGIIGAIANHALQRLEVDTTAGAEIDDKAEDHQKQIVD